MRVVGNQPDARRDLLEDSLAKIKKLLVKAQTSVELAKSDKMSQQESPSMRPPTYAYSMLPPTYAYSVRISILDDFVKGNWDHLVDEEYKCVEQHAAHQSLAMKAAQLVYHVKELREQFTPEEVITDTTNFLCALDLELTVVEPPKYTVGNKI